MPSEIRINNVPRDLKTELTNIAKHQGVNMGAFLKVKLREIVNTYPQHMRQDVKKD